MVKKEAVENLEPNTKFAREAACQGHRRHVTPESAHDPLARYEAQIALELMGVPESGHAIHRARRCPRVVEDRQQSASGAQSVPRTAQQRLEAVEPGRTRRSVCARPCVGRPP